MEEHVARRQRCLEIRDRLKRGEVHQINDLITLNLDIWQFARDAIVNSEGPELLRAFYRVIAGHIPRQSNEKYERGLSVLDPTCGSGAFLFAALRILETLYSDCLERMRRFVDELEHASEKHRPEKYADFKTVLAEIKEHPNERYFALKNIIINNLFGVDIMEEAVEICKLRLFLKLVAQVERVEQIEPLPDIDFNIRAGNTLVGYVSLDEVRRSQEGQLGFGDKEIKRIEEDALIADGAYKRFRETQVRHGGTVTAKDKVELRKRLNKLDAELDRYLAGEYGIKLDKDNGFDAWKASHQPFHWLVEFFGIMRDAGFDVINRVGPARPPGARYWLSCRRRPFDCPRRSRRLVSNRFSCAPCVVHRGTARPRAFPLSRRPMPFGRPPITRTGRPISQVLILLVIRRAGFVGRRDFPPSGLCGCRTSRSPAIPPSGKHAARNSWLVSRCRIALRSARICAQKSQEGVVSMRGGNQAGGQSEMKKATRGRFFQTDDRAQCRPTATR